jgi:hypothetical protein
MHVDKASAKEGGQSIPLDWPRSKVHTLLDQLEFYTYLGEVLRYTV